MVFSKQTSFDSIIQGYNVIERKKETDKREKEKERENMWERD